MTSDKKGMERIAPRFETQSGLASDQSGAAVGRRHRHIHQSCYFSPRGRDSRALPCRAGARQLPAAVRRCRPPRSKSRHPVRGRPRHARQTAALTLPRSLVSTFARAPAPLTPDFHLTKPTRNPGTPPLHQAPASSWR